MLISDLKEYIYKNKLNVYIVLFFTVLAYGYFITTWSISIDSEYQSFTNSPIINVWIAQGRFSIALINLLCNYRIMPFWDDFLAIFFILLSTLIWSTGLSKIRKDRGGLLIFSLIYTISPIYVFYLRFTTYNMSISIGFTLISLSIYYFISFLKNEQQRKYLVITGVFVLLAIAIYQIFILYFISSCIIAISYYDLVNHKTSKSLNYYIKNILIAVLLGLMCVAGYKIILLMLYHFIKPGDYIDSFFQWNKIDKSVIMQILLHYFHNILFVYKFNFSIIYSMIIFGIFSLYIIIRDVKNLMLIFSLTILIILAFGMPIAFGTAMPLRTMQTVPLMLAGLWLIIYTYLNNKLIKKVLLVLVIILSFFNSQYIDRLFYGDSMRLLYDKNFAGQIYTQILNKVGDQISYKPIAIIGKHSYSEKSFILKTDYDTIGHSFFEWDEGNYFRINSFMKWLGYDYITPSSEQIKFANNQALFMSDYPGNNSINITKDLIILRLSSPQVNPDQQVVNIDLNDYKKIASESQSNANLEYLNTNDKKVNLGGWAYLRSLDNLNTNKFIEFKNKKFQYIYPVNLLKRNDIADRFKDGTNLSNSGFYLTLNDDKIQSGDYDIYLILINKQQYIKINFNKKIRIN